MHGVVNLDKPVGPTSHDMVGLLRRLSGTRRIGHAGTLDPFASGVLPILVGQATRFSQELTGGAKRYEAVIRLGSRSATDDVEGPLEPGDEPPDASIAAAALQHFVGTFDQLPPVFSARKQGGRVAHRAARAGSPMELPARRVTVDSIELLGAERGDAWLDLRIDLRCQAGTYVRSIARDVGAALGCGGHLHALRRLEAAGLHVDDAITPVQLEALASDGRLVEAIRPVANLLTLPRLDVSELEADRFRHGSTVHLTAPSHDGRTAVFVTGSLLGIGTVRLGWLQPDKVISLREDGRP
jgi:tRNA pseudouridine55 synthase